MNQRHISLSVLISIIIVVTFPFGHPNVPGSDDTKTGLMVMAHGGDSLWNATVEQAVAPLADYCPTEIAFGMANSKTLQEAISKLEEQHVTNIVVVRLFISGESFLHQTEYLLGLRNDPPEKFISHYHKMTDESAMQEHIRHEKSPDPMPVQTNASIIITYEGLSDASEISQILIDRVKEQMSMAENESILFLAHGAADDDENQRWIEKINKLVEPVRQIANFRAIKVETLREDWKEKRILAEKRIHEFVEKGNENNGRVIVIPFRVQGFGPYKKVLEGYKYNTNGVGLLPHPFIIEWIRDQAIKYIQKNDWDNPFIDQLSGRK